MENTTKETLLLSFDNPTNGESAQPLDTPHFDAESIQSARPAVPLVEIRKRRFWRLVLVLIFASTLAGSVIGIALSRYQNKSERISTSAPSVTPDEPSQVASSEPLSEPVANSEKTSNEAHSERNADAERVVSLGESRADARVPSSELQDNDTRATLNRALDELIAATNARDIQRQMRFYGERVNAFYLKRNVPREAVRAEKSRVFDHANSIDIRAVAPGIRLSPDGRAASMRFRKKYAIEGGGEDRRGEVVHELRWRRTADGWKIVSERDLRVIH